MARRDYYAVLGVPRDEDPEGIRSAFRRLARRHHPDRAGEAGTRRFQDLLEAYEVLSDSERRARYDAERRDAPGRGGGVKVPVRPGRASADPVRPRACPRCGGAGALWDVPCPSCAGRGSWS